MTVAGAGWWPRRPRALAGVRAVALATGLTAGMELRLAAGGELGGSSKPSGALFGVVLVALALASGWRPGRPQARRLGGGAMAGIAAAGVLCAAPLAHRLVTGIPALPRPAWTELLLWSAATVVVAAGEEVLLRGALHEAVSQSAGTVVAVLVGALAFALLHVPLYGPGVIPLDLGVGVFLGCLRVATGGVTAPVCAHAGADLAIWWVW